MTEPCPICKARYGRVWRLLPRRFSFLLGSKPALICWQCAGLSRVSQRLERV